MASSTRRRRRQLLAAVSTCIRPSNWQAPRRSLTDRGVAKKRVRPFACRYKFFTQNMENGLFKFAKNVLTRHFRFICRRRTLLKRGMALLAKNALPFSFGSKRFRNTQVRTCVVASLCCRSTWNNSFTIVGFKTLATAFRVVCRLLLFSLV